MSSFGGAASTRARRASAARRPTACPPLACGARRAPGTSRTRWSSAALALRARNREPQLRPEVVLHREVREDVARLGHVRETQLGDACATTSAGDVVARRTRRVPARGVTTPAIADASDDLPAPLAPSTVVTDPARHVERHAEQRARFAVRDLEVGDLGAAESAVLTRSSPSSSGAVGSTSRSCVDRRAEVGGLHLGAVRISSGVPSVRSLPKSSTVTRSDRPSTNSTLCSTSTNAVPRSCAHPPQRVAELFGLVDVEARRRLVEQHHRRSDAERPARPRRRRPVPSGTPDRRPVGDRLEPEQREDLVDRFVLAGPRSLAEAGEVAEEAERAARGLRSPAARARGARAR